MNVLLSWMQEFAPITGEPEEIAKIMTDLGMVVESIETVGASWDGIIVAKVLALNPHPEADRIQLVSVDTGSAELHAAGEAGEGLTTDLLWVPSIWRLVTWCRWPPSGPPCPEAWRLLGASCGANGPTA